MGCHHGVQQTQHADVIVIGSGMAGLTAAALLAKAGKQVTVLEQNYIPGGCTTSYWRKGYWFESGATTLVGLDDYMPLQYACSELNITLPVVELAIPMQVHLKDGTLLTRYKNIDDWITEAERVFGEQGQRAFWQTCYRISQAVWRISLQQLSFPPSGWADVVDMIKHVTTEQLRYLPYSLLTVEQLLKQHGLHTHKRFTEFVNEQLIISAQNDATQVNALFGAAALCYTNYSNHYMPGGNAKLVEPFVTYITQHNGDIKLRYKVNAVKRVSGRYEVQTDKGAFSSNNIVLAIPLNNVAELVEPDMMKKHLHKVMQPELLYSAYQLNIAAKRTREYPALHQQIHLPQPLPGTDAGSIFLSVSHPQDRLRCAADELVASVTTHIRHPHTFKADKAAIDDAVLNLLHEKNLIHKSDIIYRHSSDTTDWEKWTGRKYGFVGGYPQYKHIKPWQMVSTRLDHAGAYLCGDSVYPGQGIPGVTLSGIIAARTLLRDE